MAARNEVKQRTYDETHITISSATDTVHLIAALERLKNNPSGTSVTVKLTSGDILIIEDDGIPF